MSNYELINELRDQAEVIGPGTEYHLLMEAADVIEALDERVAIMSEPRGARVMDRVELNLMQAGDACWLEMRDCSWPDTANRTGWVILRQVVRVQSKDDWCWYFGTPLHPNTLPLPESTYGVEWRCWSAKPTDEQRKVVKWG